jgi:hypothetical protein
LNNVKINRSRYYNYNRYYYNRKYDKGYGDVETGNDPSVESGVIGGSRKPVLLKSKKKIQEEKSI